MVKLFVKQLNLIAAFFNTLQENDCYLFIKITPKDEIGGDRMAKVQGLEKNLIRYATVHLDNLNIDLLQYIEPAPTQADYSNERISAMHLCFEVDDFDEAIKRMESAGIVFHGQPMTFEEEDGLKAGIGTSVAYFKDPDGTNLEVIAPQGPFKRLEQ